MASSPHFRYRLPPETTTHIVSYLWADRDSLNSSSLVCRSWRPAVRPYIHRSVWLNGPKSALELERRLEETPAMCHWVRELRLTCRPALVDRIPDDLWTAATLARVFRKLEDLYTVVIGDSLGMLTKSETTELEKSAGFPSVRELTFPGPRGGMPSLDFGRAFIESFPNLSSLYFHRDRFIEEDQEVVERTVTFPRLRSLTVFQPIPALCFLYSIENLQSLEVLHIRYTPSEEELQSLSVMLDGDVGHRLRSISFLYPHSQPPPEVDHFLYPHRQPPPEVDEIQIMIEDALSRWMSLPTLRTRLSIGEMTIESTTSTFSALDKLKMLPVEEIGMGMSFNLVRQFRPRDYQEMAQKFAEAFPSLKTVHFVYVGRMSAQKVEAKVYEVFPSFASRGVAVEVEKLRF